MTVCATKIKSKSASSLAQQDAKFVYIKLFMKQQKFEVFYHVEYFIRYRIIFINFNFIATQKNFIVHVQENIKNSYYEYYLRILRKSLIFV